MYVLIKDVPAAWDTLTKSNGPWFGSLARDCWRLWPDFELPTGPGFRDQTLLNGRVECERAYRFRLDGALNLLGGIARL